MAVVRRKGSLRPVGYQFVCGGHRASCGVKSFTPRGSDGGLGLTAARGLPRVGARSGAAVLLFVLYPTGHECRVDVAVMPRRPAPLMKGPRI